MVTNVSEVGLSPEERAVIVEWLMNTGNSFLKKIKKESEWGAFRDFFAEFAHNLQIHRVAFAKDFVSIYHEAADNFQHPREGEYCSGTHGEIHGSIFEVVKSLFRDNLIPARFVEEIKQREAAERIIPLARNN